MVKGYFKIWLLIFLLASGQSWAQLKEKASKESPFEAIPFFENHTPRTGLPSNEVLKIKSDSRGYIWFLSPNGLIRYNGLSYRHFVNKRGNPKSLRHNWVEDMAEDPDGNLWLGTADGLCIWDRKKEDFSHYTFPPQIEKLQYRKDVTAVYFDSLTQSLFFSDLLGIHQLPLKSRKPKSWLIFEGDKKYHKIVSFYRDSQKRLWVGALNYGVYLWSDSSGSFLPIQAVEAQAERIPQALHFAEPIPGKLMISTWGDGFLKIEKVEGRKVWFKRIKWNKKPALTYWANIATSPLIKPPLPWPDDGKAYFSSADGGIGVYNLETDSISFMARNDLMPNSSIIETGHGAHFAANSLWFSRPKGVSQFRLEPRFFERYMLHWQSPKGTGKKGDYYIASACKDAQNARVVWFVTEKGLLGKWDQDKKNLIWHGSLLKSDKDFLACREMLAWKNYLMVISDISCHIWNTQTQKPVREKWAQIIEELKPREIVVEPGGKFRLLHATKGLFLLDPVQNTLEQLVPPTEGQNRYFHSLRDENKHLWISSSLEWVKCWNAAKKSWVQLSWKNKTGSESLVGNYKTVKDRQGRLWISSSAGLFWVDLKNGTQYEYINPRYGSNTWVEGLEIDQKGMIWALSRNFLCRIDPATLRCENFDHTLGLEGGMIPGMKKLDETSFLVFTENLAWQFNPLLFKTSESGTRLLLDYIEKNGKRLSVSDSVLELNHEEKSVRLGFFPSWYQPKDNLEYDISMGNGKQTLLRFDRPEVAFSYLEPGSYQLLARVGNRNHTWQSPAIRIRVEVLPPWYKTDLAMAAWAFFLIGFTGMGFTIRYRILKRKSDEKARIEKMVADLESKTLRSQMNPHFIFNALNSIQQFILRNNPLEASDYLARFSRMIRLVLESSIENQTTLTQEKELLTNYLELEKLRSNHKFNYRINLAEGLDAEQKLPSMIAQPYIENAIWHGVNGLEGKGEIEIRFFEKDQALFCTVTDNGIGREEARRRQSANQEKKHVSRALNITEQRLKILYPSEKELISIEDIVDNEGNVQGTLVTIKMPKT